MRNAVAPKWLLPMFWVVTAAFFVLLGGKAHAAEQWIPDQDHMSEGSQVFLEVSRPGNGNSLDAHLTYAKVYFKSSTGTVEIRSKDHCENGGPDSTTYAPTTYRFFHINDHENIATVAPISAASNITSSHITNGNCPGDTSVTLSGLKSPSIPGRQGWYVAIIEVEHTGGANSGGVNAFRIKAVNGRAEYWDMGLTALNDNEPSRRAFAIQDRYGGLHSTGNYNFWFAPRCDEWSDSDAFKIAYLKWFDADEGEGNQSGNIKFTLYSYDRDGGGQTALFTIQGNDLGGNNDYEYRSFRAYKEKKYRWVWENVDKANGIQMWMPYDSFDAKVQCNSKVIAYRVPTGTLTQSDVNGQPIDVKQPFNGSNFNQTDTTGDTAEYNNVPYGGIRVDGSNNRGYEMRSRHRICRKDLPCDNFTNFTGWGSTIRVDNYNVDAGATVDVRIQYRLPAFAASCHDPVDSTAANTTRIARAGRTDHTFQATFRNNGGGSWPDGGNITADATYAGTTKSAASIPVTTSGNLATLSFPDFTIVSDLDASRWVTFRILRDGTVLALCRATVRPYTNFQLTPSVPTFKLSDDGTTATFNSQLSIDLINVPDSTNVIFPSTNNVLVTTRRVTRNGNPIHTYPAWGDNTAERYNASNALPHDSSPNSPPRWNETPSTGAQAIGDEFCGFIVVNIGSGHLYGNGEITPVDGPRQSSMCDDVRAKPYLKVYGNDVMAGGGFGSCTPHSGGIRTHGKQNAANRFIGSSVQHAAFALNQITGFTSANLRTSFPQAHKDLSFANHGAGVNTSWTNASSNAGGFFDPPTTSTCMPDYFGYNGGSTLFPGAAPAQSAHAKNFLNSVAASPDFQRRRTSSGATVNLDGSSPIPIGIGQRKVLFVDGVLNINTNIEYANFSGGNPDDVPALYIVAREINISNAVTRLDGVYIAQPSNATNGNITTCSQGLDYVGCKNQLMVHGSFIAKKINFFRTYGTLDDGIAAEAPSAARPCTASAGAASSTAGVCAGEVFRFSPELYLAPSPFREDDDSFDAYRGLPPNL